MIPSEVYAGRRVFVTGHTGFKGAWLTEWLLRLGADVTGYALAPPTQPNLYDALDLGSRLRHVQADIRDGDRLAAEMQAARPSVVFHLAAQAIVRRAYADPRETFATNVMGTVNVLDAARVCPSVQAVVIVTSDKCYENRERGPPVSGDGRHGRPRPVQRQQGCRGAGHRGLSRQLLHRTTRRGRDRFARAT